MTRAARRRQERQAKKEKKISPSFRAYIVTAHWRDEWHFNDRGLIIRDKRTRRVIAEYPGV